MTRYTPDYSLPAPEERDPVLTSGDIWALATKTEQAVKSVDNKLPNYALRAPILLDGPEMSSPLTPELLEGLDTGRYVTRFGASSIALGAPDEVPAEFSIRRWGSTSGLMTVTTREIDPKTYERARLSNGWSAWSRTDADRDSLPAPKQKLQVVSPSSLKTAALAFTTGYSGERINASGTTAVLQRIPKSAIRARVHIRNWNPRYNTDDRGPVALNNVRFGLDAGSGAGTGWVSLGSGETEFQSHWFNLPVGAAGNDCLLEYSWSGSDVTRCLGTGWTNGSSDQRPPLFVWLEIEVPATTPVVGVMGSSSAAGVGTPRPLVDSWLSMWAQAHNAVPMFWAHSGDSAINWDSETDRKWELYGTQIAAPDAMLYANALNDWGAGVSLEELRSRIANNVNQIRTRISDAVYGTTITPRTPVPSNDSTRVQLNEWMKTSGIFRDVFDFSAAVSKSDGTLNPAFNADGTHLNLSGHSKLAESVSRPIVASQA